jgi:ligand-binding sensor domain-containing protein
MICFRNIHFLSLILLSWSIQAYCKEYAIVHYNRSNGFSGNYCYVICQDKKGYIWMSSENGLARFNGYEFKLFTTKDGLHDNEVFDLKEDSRGRLWFAPFANSTGYIYNEKIYNIETDSSLRRIHFKSRPEQILLDGQGNIFFLEYPFATCLSKDGRIRRIYFDFPKGTAVSFFIHFGKLHTIIDKGVFEFVSGRFVFKSSALFLKNRPYCNAVYQHMVSSIGPQSASQFFKRAVRFNKLFQSEESIKRIRAIYAISPQILAITSENGCYLVDRTTTAVLDTLLLGYNIGGFYQSPDSSLWIGTLGNGVFRFIPSRIKELKSPAFPSAVQFINATSDSIYCVLENGWYAITSFDKKGLLTLSESNYLQGQESNYPITYIGMNGRNKWVVCGREINLQKRLADKPLLRTKPISSKNAFNEDKNHMLIACYSGLIRLDQDQFTITDTLVDWRTTSVAKVNQTIYAGTLRGLFSGTTKHNFHPVLSSNPSLNTHIVHLWVSEDSILWVANNKTELIALRNDKVTFIINDRNGLQCNRISAIRSSKNFVWVGTDNGLYAFQNRPLYPVAFHLTYTNGLNSTQVNCLDIQNGRLFVGTSAGVNYFDEKDIIKQGSSSALFVNNISNNGKNIPLDTGILILDGKSLSIDFDIIDYTGGQKPLFQYRFQNDASWVSLESSNLYFPELPFGHFTIDIRATLPNWESNSQYRLHFYRPYPFYLQWWVIILGALLLLTVITGCIISYLKWARKKDNRKIAFQRNLLQLEQMALQGQLNPHFIFNCMTAIKQHYNAGNLQKANEFLDAFAALIRQTFEMSTETFISLDKELDFLNRYLSIEQVRFGYAFDFFINKNLTISDAIIPVPAMLLQPFAENAVRHGVRHLSERRGKIIIDVRQQNNRMQVVITDNGIGRSKANSFFSHITSTSVNSKRMQILNQLFEQQIIHEVEDVIDDEGDIAGTRIIISYPLDINKL